MTRSNLIAIFVLLATIGVFGQNKKPPEKIIELLKLTSKIATAKLTPIWNSHKCNDPREFYVINYGKPAEIRRRKRILMQTIGRRCDFDPFRITFVDGPNHAKPTTILWRTDPNGEKPIP